MYGKRHTPETKEKIRNSKRGQTHTLETRSKISAAVKGENHLMYGKHHTPESIEKTVKHILENLTIEKALIIQKARKLKSVKLIPADITHPNRLKKIVKHILENISA